jgi:hypothetical protein
MAPDLTSRPRWTPALSRVLWLRTPPPDQGGLQRCHVSYSFRPRLPAEVGFGAATCPTGLCATCFKHKEKPSKSACAARHAYSQHTRTRFQGPHIRAIMHLQYVQCSIINTCKACGQTSTVRLQYSYSATPALWTTHLAPLQCQVTRQYDATLLTECSVAGDKTRCAHTVEDIICYS